jgi:hypothetical protein
MKEKPKRNFASTLRDILGNVVFYLHSNEMENAGLSYARATNISFCESIQTGFRGS